MKTFLVDFSKGGVFLGVRPGPPMRDSYEWSPLTIDAHGVLSIKVRAEDEGRAREHAERVLNYHIGNQGAHR